MLAVNPAKPFVQSTADAVLLAGTMKCPSNPRVP